jgi:predicted nuclease of predicted toxin-antitoxin system
VKLLVDANLSPTVAEALRQAGHDATHVVEHGLMTASDERIALFAVDQVHVIVSADSDFARRCGSAR